MFVVKTKSSLTTAKGTEGSTINNDQFKSIVVCWEVDHFTQVCHNIDSGEQSSWNKFESIVGTHSYAFVQSEKLRIINLWI